MLSVRYRRLLANRCAWRNAKAKLLEEGRNTGGEAIMAGDFLTVKKNVVQLKSHYIF